MRIVNFSEDENNNTVVIKLKLTSSEFNEFNVQNYDINKLTGVVNDYLDVENIIHEVCSHFKINENQIKKVRRSGRLLKQGNLVDVRRLCYYFMRKYTSANLTKIGNVFNQSHANVLYHLRCVDAWIETDGFLQQTITTIDNKIKSKIYK